MENGRKSAFADPPPGAPRGTVWGHLGDLGRLRADIFSVFGCPVGGRRDDRRFDGQNVHTRTAQGAETIIKTNVFECFHFLQKVGLGVPRGWIFRTFGGPWGSFGIFGVIFSGILAFKSRCRKNIEKRDPRVTPRAFVYRPPGAPFGDIWETLGA